MGKNDHRTTQQLVIRIHGGDREAFDLLFMRYYPRIKLLVRLQMLDKLKIYTGPEHPHQAQQPESRAMGCK